MSKYSFPGACTVSYPLPSTRQWIFSEGIKLKIMAKAHCVPVLMPSPVFSAAIFKTAPEQGSSMISLFVKWRKQKPREVTSLAKSHTSVSGSAKIWPRPSGHSSHTPNHVIFVFCPLLPSLSAGTCPFPSLGVWVCPSSLSADLDLSLG